MPRRRNFEDIDFETLADLVAQRVVDHPIATGSGSLSFSTSDNTVTNIGVGDPNMFRVHDILPGVQDYPDYRLDTYEATDAYQSRILQLIARVEVLETRLAEVSQLLVEHVKRSNPPIDRKKRRCVILEKEEE